MNLTHAGRKRLRVLATGVAAVAATTSFVGAALIWPTGQNAAIENTSAARSDPSPAPSQRPARTAPHTPAAGQAESDGKDADRRVTRRAAPSPAAAEPARVVVPQLNVEAAVVPIASSAGALDPPPDPQVLGWWSGGAVPGAATGSALLAGHTVHDGGGALDHLESVRRGALVRVTTSRGTIDYTVSTVQVLDKATLAEQATRLFSQEVDGRLVLVTCEGWDGTGYRSNVVVTAVPTT